MVKKRFVIDTDAVADDIRAISLAIQHDNVEVNLFKLLNLNIFEYFTSGSGYNDCHRLCPRQTSRGKCL